MGSVRARTAAAATAVVALALALAGIALLLVLQRNLVDQADLQADVAARRVASQIANGTPYDKLDLPDSEDHPVQVVDDDGRVLAVGEDIEAISGAGSGRTKVTAPPGEQPGTEQPGDDADDADDSAEADGDDEGPGTVADDADYRFGSATVDGQAADFRFAAVEAQSRQGLDVTVYAGAPLAAQEATVGQVREAMLVALPVLLVVVAGVTWLMTRRALRPVEGIRAEMAAITASEDLTRRVPEPDAHDEVARLARTTNETLAALETSVDRQRRFVADASHELRSPIASLRTQLEVAAAHPDLLDLPGAVADTVRLQGLAADLLLLARLDAGERPGDARVDLGALVREEVSQRTHDRFPVEVTAAEGVELSGSRSQLARVLGNLLDNAQRHARSAVTVTAGAEGDSAVLRVADDGSGVPEEERERIFERFVRLDDARSRDDGGAGLGLAIARDVVQRHGGSLTVGRSAQGGALFEMRLPKS
ncbi:sensor histidine kinase [Streptomyces sp. NPDC002851]